MIKLEILNAILSLYIEKAVELSEGSRNSYKWRPGSWGRAAAGELTGLVVNKTKCEASEARRWERRCDPPVE